ncbi:MAG: hypothetical protein JSV68_18625 [Anaerolineaceae bacterium]|nr:MAG: hypothetical protein JSV68_18625 [Anaerolineaceae bacterium]
MTTHLSEDRELQAQIEEAAARVYSTEDIEERIARALVTRGEFYEDISSADLEVILRNIVYVMFARQKVAGREIGILHNVPIMQVEINNQEALVEFVVHIHKPIIVFIEFKYTLVNHEDEDNKCLCLKEDSLRVKEKTRRFDVKAKAALTAMNVPKIARQEMSDLTNVICRTLPDQLRHKGVTGQLEKIKLSLNDHSLCVCLTGDFGPLPETA